MAQRRIDEKVARGSKLCLKAEQRQSAAQGGHKDDSAVDCEGDERAAECGDQQEQIAGG